MRVVQLSDIHWGAAPAPVDGRDAATSFAHVIDHVRANVGTPDLFVATGDLTDDATEHTARSLAHRFADLGVPVHCLAGNHDGMATLPVLAAATPAVRAPVVSRHGPWLFCYVDSNDAGVVHGADGTRTDHPDRMHRAARFAIAGADLDALDRALADTDAEHAMVWTHHPPLPPPIFDRPDARPAGFVALHEVLRRHGIVRAVAAGHMHTGFANRQDGIAYLGTPTTWLGMDFDRRVLTSPGYRTFVFHHDGRIDTRSVLIDHEAYPEGLPLPEWVTKIFAEHTGLPLDPEETT